MRATYIEAQFSFASYTMVKTYFPTGFYGEKPVFLPVFIEKPPVFLRFSVWVSRSSPRTETGEERVAMLGYAVGEAEALIDKAEATCHEAKEEADRLGGEEGILGIILGLYCFFFLLCYFLFLILIWIGGGVV